MNRKAFTLMELLLVVAVLAIISVVAAPYFNEAAITMHDGTAESMTKNLISNAKSMAIAGRIGESKIDFKTDGSITIGSNTYSLPARYGFKESKSFKFDFKGKCEPSGGNVKITCPSGGTIEVNVK